MKRKINYLLVGIFLVAFILRFWGVAGNPPSLNWDEISQGYNSYSILKTGQDDWGQFLPITNFRAYGDYPTTLYLYLVMPFIAVLGLNDLSVRMPSVISGALLAVVIYYLSKRIFKRDDVSIFAAVITAISPWNFLLSRQAIQATPAILILATGVWLFLKGVQSNLKWSIFGSIIILLSAYGYHNTRIISPVILVGLLFLYRRLFLKQRKILLIIIATMIIFFIPLGVSVLSGTASARAVWVGILDQGAINDINMARGSSPLPPVETKLVFNKITYFGYKFALNYIGYFDPMFLGVKGGSQYQYSVQGFGVLNMAEVPLFYIGLAFLLWKIKKLSVELKILFFWLLLGPIPGAITKDAYQVVRTTTFMPPVYLLVGLGAGIVFDFFHKRLQMKPLITGTVLVLLSLTTFGLYLNNFWNIYPVKYSEAWQYGYKQAIEYAQANYSNYDQIIFTKKYAEPHEYVLFYTKYDPAKYRSDPNLVRYQRSDWYWVDAFDKYRFIDDWSVKDETKGLKHTLLITSPGNYPVNSTKLETIKFLDGTDAFDIVRLD